MDSFSLDEAKAHLGELIDRVQAGETIEITREGESVAKLAGPARRRTPQTRIDPSIFDHLDDFLPQNVDAGTFIWWLRDTDRY